MHARLHTRDPSPATESVRRIRVPNGRIARGLIGGPTREEYMARLSPAEWEIMLGLGKRLATHPEKQQAASAAMAMEAIPPPAPVMWMCNGCGNDVLRGVRCKKCGSYQQESPPAVRPDEPLEKVATREAAMGTAA